MAENSARLKGQTTSTLGCFMKTVPQDSESALKAQIQDPGPSVVVKIIRMAFC